MAAVSLRDFTVMTVNPAHRYLYEPTFYFNLPPRPVGILIRIGAFIGASEWAIPYRTSDLLLVREEKDVSGCCRLLQNPHT